MTWIFPVGLLAFGLFSLQHDTAKVLVFLDGANVGAGAAMCLCNVLIARIKRNR